MTGMAPGAFSKQTNTKTNMVKYVYVDKQTNIYIYILK